MARQGAACRRWHALYELCGALFELRDAFFLADVRGQPVTGVLFLSCVLSLYFVA